MSNERSTRYLQVAALSASCVLVIVAIGCGGSGGGSDEPREYLDADGVIGGKLYDKFWATETGWNQADPNLAIFNAKADFFRCKQCHGWDRKGALGGYINRGPNANRPRVSTIDLAAFAANSTPQQIFDALKTSVNRRAVDADLSTYHPTNNPTVGDQMPDIGSFMSDGQLWNLAKFLKRQALNVDDLYDSQTTGTYPTGSIQFSNIGKNGDAGNGADLFRKDCAGCHGKYGTAFTIEGLHVGGFLRSKPHETQHKVRFGQLGSAMDHTNFSPGAMKDLYKALSDPANFPN